MVGFTTDNDDDEKPLDPMVENVRRRMMRLMIISIGIMMVGLMAVLGAIVYKYNTGGKEITSSESASVQPVAVSRAVSNRGKIRLPDGATIETSSLAGDRILLTVKLVDGSTHLMVFDMITATVIADFSVVNDT